MLYINKVLFLSLIFISLINITLESTHDLYNPAFQKKLQQKIRHDLHTKRGFKKTPMCENMMDWHPKVKKERFLLTGLFDSTLSSIDSFAQLDNCTIDAKLIEITWRYEFFESMHCIKVELDLGFNITNFVQKINYNYYGFSYRELGKRNQYLSRQLLNESVNTLTIRNANHRPYIICVTFYKNPYLLSSTQSIQNQNNFTDTTNTSSNSSIDIDCEEYSTIFSEDQRTHDANLCIDIDTQAHFLAEVTTHGSIHGSEFVMVIFIFCLIMFMLFSISFGNFIIQRPKKQRFLDTLRKYVTNKLHDQDNNDNVNNFSSTAGFHILNESNTSIKTSNLIKPHTKPIITVSDYSSATSLHDNNNLNTTSAITYPPKSNYHSEPKETDRLLSINSNDDNSNTSTTQANPTPAVTFHVGETIIEEDNEGEETSRNDPKRSASIKSTDNETACIKTISHLLDDKPWGPSRSNSVVTTNFAGLQNRRFSEFDMARLRLHLNALYNNKINTDSANNNPS